MIRPILLFAAAAMLSACAQQPCAVPVTSAWWSSAPPAACRSSRAATRASWRASKGWAICPMPRWSSPRSALRLCVRARRWADQGRPAAPAHRPPCGSGRQQHRRGDQPDGRLIAVGNYEPGGVKVFDAETLELVADIPATPLADGSRNSRVVGVLDAPGRRFIYSLFDTNETRLLDFSRGRYTDRHAFRERRQAARCAADP